MSTLPVHVASTSLSDGEEFRPTSNVTLFVVPAGATASFEARQTSDFSPLTVINAETGEEVTSGEAGTYIARVPSGTPTLRATGAATTAVGIS